ncbi:hypothetical protein GCM10011391_31600 [Pullulanibacillus camelliae]|uniref:Uncharacterized protein n=1 Tax=Pullulanibacillus camelliae TaxID=1707096 RepID=A0A8J3DYW3_9BACL|nr:hypothetical protein [Pullulanibacillus camelliae]GGE50503.1 hypothetical protein GCM10011391_31600 [Pullulanibacillus camelliae]
MWIFIGILLALIIWVIFKLSIVSLYVILFAGIVLGALPYFFRRKRYIRK